MTLEETVLASQIYAEIIIRDLTPQDVLALMAVSKGVSTVYQLSLLWEKKFQRYFPEHYQPIQWQRMVHWFDAFKAVANQYYARLGSGVAKLFLAAKSGDEAVFENLQGPEFYYEDKLGGYLIQCVAQHASPRLRRFVFEKYILPYFKDEAGNINFDKFDYKEFYQVLHHAARLNQLDLLPGLSHDIVVGHEYRYLDDNPKDRPLCTPLQIAAGYGHVEAIQTLLALGASLHFATLHHSLTPLHRAAHFGQLEAMRVLLDAGANIESVGLNCVGTPLYAAAVGGRLDAFNFLRERGASLQPAHLPQEAPTLLHWAVHGGNLEILKDVIGLFDIDVRDAVGETPLHWAALRGNRQVYQYLIDKKANPALVSTEGNTVLHYAVKSNNVGFIKMLLTVGADPRARNQAGKTPLDDAAASAGIDRGVIEVLKAENNKHYGSLRLFGASPSAAPDPSRDLSPERKSPTR